jgi:hypothetical protein
LASVVKYVEQFTENRERKKIRNHIFQYEEKKLSIFRLLSNRIYSSKVFQRGMGGRGFPSAFYSEKYKYIS